MVSEAAVNILAAGNQPTDPVIDAKSEQLFLQLVTLALCNLKYSKYVTPNDGVSQRQSIFNFVPNYTDAPFVDDEKLALLTMLVKSRTEGERKGYTITYKDGELSPEQKIVIDQHPLDARVLSKVMLLAAQKLVPHLYAAGRDHRLDVTNELEMFAQAFQTLAVPMLNRGALLDSQSRERLQDAFEMVSDAMHFADEAARHTKKVATGELEAATQAEHSLAATTREFSRLAEVVKITGQNR